MKLLALGVIAAILSATTGAALAQNRHPVCETKQHDCGKAAKISSCCCGDVGTSRDSGAQPQSRHDGTNGNASGPVLPATEHALPDGRPTVAVQTSPPRQRPLDLWTLFSTLLI